MSPPTKDLHLQLMLLWSAILFLTKDSSSLKSMSIHVPTATRAGETVTLSCEYDLEQVPLYSTKWYWNDEEFYRYVPKESPPVKAFKVNNFDVDTSKSGPNEVTLRSVVKEISGLYKCEVSSDGPLFHTDIKMAHMIVVEPPGNHQSVRMYVDPERVEVGREITGECTAPPAEPPANITWYLNGEEVLHSAEGIDLLPIQLEMDSITKRRSAISKLVVSTNRSHFVMGKLTVECKAWVYDVWRLTGERTIRSYEPHLAPALGSTSSQSQMDAVVEVVGRASAEQPATPHRALLPSLLCCWLIITLTR